MIKAKLVFKTMPLSTNALYANFGNRRLKTSKGRENTDEIGWEARNQYKGTPIESPVRLKIALWWDNKRKHDIDNIKVLLDSLTGICWLDDGQITDLHITKGYDKENPRAEMEIYAEDTF